MLYLLTDNDHRTDELCHRAGVLENPGKMRSTVIDRLGQRGVIESSRLQVHLQLTKEPGDYSVAEDGATVKSMKETEGTDRH